MKQHLKAIVAVLFVGSLIFLGVYKYMEKLSKGGTQVVQKMKVLENQGLGEFKALSIKGKEMDLEAYRDKVVIVNFWASWCGPCVEEVPSMIKLVNEFKGQLVLLAVSGDSNMEDVNVFIKSFPEMNTHPDIHVIWQEDKALLRKYDIQRLPESFIVGKDGKLAKVLSGAIDWYTEDSKAYMKSLGLK